MYGINGVMVKMFKFYNSDTSIGDKERIKVEQEINGFLCEYDGNIIDIQLNNNIVMVVYRAME